MNVHGLSDIKDINDALVRCCGLSGMSDKEIAGRLGVGYGHFARMLNANDALHFPPELIVPLMIVCGNVLPLEWLAWQMGYALHEKSMSEVLRAISAALTSNGAWVDFRVSDRGTVAEMGRPS